MSKSSTRVAFALALAVCAAAGLAAQSSPASGGYKLPPKVIVDILDAAPTPTVIVAPNRRVVALLERRSMPGIAALAEPIHRIAGARINPRTNGRQQRTGDGIAITLKAIPDGADMKVVVPQNANVGGLAFSPDGNHLAFTNTRANGVELWVADTATGQSRLVTGADRLNAAAGEPCTFRRTSARPRRPRRSKTC